MKLLHTSDWHLGVSFNDQKRNEEFKKIFDWLIDQVEREKVDLFVIAGDVFDSANPPNDAVSLLYEFIDGLADTCCRHLVVVGGNHDSPSRLDAPSRLLERVKGLDITFLGCIDPENPEKEILVLNDSDGTPESIVCAVPYLHDRYIRTAETGETMNDRTLKQIAGITAHYTEIGRLAEEKREEIKEEYGKEIPILMTGHLFMVGESERVTRDGGIRDLFVGGLNGISADNFPKSADYIALGHIHIPHKIGNNEHIRYSGSLLPIGFDEAKYDKKVYLVDFEGTKPAVNELIVPQSRRMELVTGSTFGEIFERIENLLAEGSSETIYFAVRYSGNEYDPSFKQRINARVEGTNLNCCGIVLTGGEWSEGIQMKNEGETVKELSEMEVFGRLLKARNVPDERYEGLTELYREVLRNVDQPELMR